MHGLDRVATVFFAVIGAGVGAPFDVAALDVTALQLEAHASVTPAVVPLNGQFTLEVQVTGTNRIDVEPSLPDLGDFSRYIGRNSSTSMQMINGVTTVSLVIQYRYRAIREGHLRDRGRRGRGRGAGAPDAAGHVDRVHRGRGGRGWGAGPENPAGVDPDDLFIVAEVSKTRVYQNEPIEVSYRLFTPRQRDLLHPGRCGRERGLLGGRGPRVRRAPRSSRGFETDSRIRPLWSGASSSFPRGRGPRPSNR